METPPQRSTAPWTGMKLQVNIKASDQVPPLLRTVTATGTNPSTAYRTENRGKTSKEHLTVRAGAASALIEKSSDQSSKMKPSKLSIAAERVQVHLCHCLCSNPSSVPCHCAPGIKSLNLSVSQHLHL